MLCQADAEIKPKNTEPGLETSPGSNDRRDKNFLIYFTALTVYLSTVIFLVAVCPPADIRKK